MTEIWDLDGFQKRCPPKEDQHLRNKKNYLIDFFNLRVLGMARCLSLYDAGITYMRIVLPEWYEQYEGSFLGIFQDLIIRVLF